MADPVDFNRFGAVLGIEEAAQILGIHHDTARRYVREGVIPGHRLPGGRKLYLLKDELLAYLRERPGGSAGHEATSPADAGTGAPGGASGNALGGASGDAPGAAGG